MGSDCQREPVGSVLVVGGGIGGMQAALDLAESGYKVYLLERDPSIGGTMAQLDKTFPTNDCAMCTLAPRLVDCGKHLNIERLTYAELLEIEGQAGRFRVRVRQKARSVDPAKCTGCGECMDKCLVHNRPQPATPETEPETVVPADLARLQAILEQNGRRREASLAILQDTAAAFRWLPEWSLRVIARELGIPLSQILRVATFFKALSLKPRGQHTCTVCTGTACHVRGAPKLVEKLESDLGIKVGETTPDLRVTLETVNCVGACALGPLVLVDGEYHGNLSLAGLDRIVKGLRK